jgi:hypothetical protein
MTVGPVARKQRTASLEERLFADLNYIRKRRPFGHRKVDERLANTPALGELAAQLYGPAATLGARDRQLRSLIVTASKKMEGTNGEALRCLLGLTAETSGKLLPPRQEAASQLFPSRSGSSLGRTEYFGPLLELAVIALEEVTTASISQQDPAEPLRDVDLPIVDRGVVESLIYELRHPGRESKQAQVIFGPPGSGTTTCTEQTLARITIQNRHTVRLHDPGTYHRDLLSVLTTYGRAGAETWSLAACEHGFRDLLALSPDALGGIVLDGVSEASQVAHLIPLWHRAHVLIAARRRSPARPAPFNEWPLGAMNRDEAKQLLASGRPRADPEQLDLLGELLYRDAGLLAAAARARVTTATLIRRLRRARTDTVLQLAELGGTDLQGYAQQIIQDLNDNADALLALDVALWLTGAIYWDLYHTVGFLLPGHASPARVDRALAHLDYAGLGPAWWQVSPLVPVLRQLRANRMAPLLHGLAALGEPDADAHADHPLALSVSIRPGQPKMLHVDGQDMPVTICYSVLNGHGYAALFRGPDGQVHAQLYRPEYFGVPVLEPFEDGEQRPQHSMLDPDADTTWPEVTHYMLGLFGGPDAVPFNEVGMPGAITVSHFEGPIHQNQFTGHESFNEAIDLDARVAEDGLSGGIEVPPRDESIDEELGEIFG